jgi:hypothetical protein
MIIHIVRSNYRNKYLLLNLNLFTVIPWGVNKPKALMIRWSRQSNTTNTSVLC